MDDLLYAVHFGFWLSLAVAHWFSRDIRAGAASPDTASPAQNRTAPYSRALLMLHAIAFGIMYFGVGKAVFGNEVPVWFVGQRILGTVVVACGAALASWAFLLFRSWRFRAKLDEGHVLTPDGPFRLLRHPIYMSVNMLSLGTALWAPNVPVLIAVALMVVGSDLRARVEEALLTQAFGTAYEDYCSRTKRFLPGIY